MSRRTLNLLLILVASLATAGTAREGLAQYRGMTPGWPQVASGYYASAAPAYGYAQPMMQPGMAQPYVAARPPLPMQYAPVTAYANPYAAAYNMPAYARPAATTAYYAPPADQYAPSASYNYGPTMRVAYMAPPQFAYMPMQSPVVAYRPVTVYQPGTGQAMTCLQPVAPTTCYQPAPQPTCGSQSSCGRGWFSWLNPFRNCRWFKGSGCGSAPTTAYCGSAATTCGTSGCAQPYYPTQPTIVVPTQPAVIPAQPSGVVPSIRSPILGTPTVPPPPTRFNSTIPGGTVAPADTRPNLGPPAGGTIINPNTPIQPGGSFNPNPGGAFNPGPTGSFPSGGNYPPATDPYSGASLGTPQPQSQPQTNLGPILNQPQQPTRSPALNSSVQPVPDPDARTPKSPINRAPQLLDPRDKTAQAGDTRWAVVPAKWPTKSTGSSFATELRPYAERSYSEPRVQATPVSTHALNPADFDDSGWKSARW